MAGMMGAIGTGASLAATVSNPVGWVVGGLGVLGSWLSASSKQQAASERIGYISQQQAGLTQALGQVGEIAEQRTDIAQDVYGEGIAEASFGAGQSLYDITRQEGTAIQKSNLARSGTIEQMTGPDRDWETS